MKSSKTKDLGAGLWERGEWDVKDGRNPVNGVRQVVVVKESLAGADSSLLNKLWVIGQVDQQPGKPFNVAWVDLPAALVTSDHKRRCSGGRTNKEYRSAGCENAVDLARHYGAAADVVLRYQADVAYGETLAELVA